ncbi:enolase 4 [Syngnathus typhle]|uniref:enolase 4 n=1 Tax=Syngnathus typhle TaxID=161592 RepID=UPI002A69C38F|nr:enolase 4 [Syngnathus typhle]
MSAFVKSLSEQDQEFHQIKDAAAEFYRANRVPEELEKALGELFFQNPEDVHGYLANYFTRLSSHPFISRLNGKEVYDSKGQLCAEAQLFCIICNQEKRMSSAAISSHFPHNGSLAEWRPKSQERAHHVAAAVQWIVEPLNGLLKGHDPCDQSQVDQQLSDFFAARQQEEKENREKEEILSASEQEVEIPSSPPEKKKEKKNEKKKKGNLEKPFCPAEPPEPVFPGCLAIGSVSLAVAKSGAQVKASPLYKYIRSLKDPEDDQDTFHVPVPLVTLLSCGKMCPGKLNLLEEVILIPNAGQQVKQIITMATRLQKEMMRILSGSSKPGVTAALLSDNGVLPVSFDRPEQALDLITEACNNLQLELGTEIHLAVNCAGPDLMDYTKQKYEIATGAFKSPDELVSMYQSLLSKYTAVVALIDPLRREDAEQWQKLSDAIGQSCVLLSDATHKAQAPPLPGVTGRLLKHTNQMTVSDLIRITSEHPGSVLLAKATNESCQDDSLSDIAVGLGLDYVKLGGLTSGERMTKYNRLLSIEEELSQQGILVPKEQHSLPLFIETEAEAEAEAEEEV